MPLSSGFQGLPAFQVTTGYARRFRKSREIFDRTVKDYSGLDNTVNIWIMIAMSKFYDLLADKEIRKKLVAAGIKQSTITLWKQKKRFPLIVNAQRLSVLLRIPMKQIPWTSGRWERNEP